MDIERDCREDEEGRDCSETVVVIAVVVNVVIVVVVVVVVLEVSLVSTLYFSRRPVSFSLRWTCCQ
jgi:hypothetical protein